MTVADLQAALNRMPGDWLVVLAGDAEGNYFCDLEEVLDNQRYNPETGDCGFAVLDQGLRAEGYEEEDIQTTGVRCVVLWP